MKLKSLVVLAVVLGLVSSASAVLVIDEDTISTERWQIDDEGGLTVTNGATYLNTNRIDHDGSDITVHGGSEIQFNQYKLPDNEGDHLSRVYLDDGATMVVSDAQVMEDRLASGAGIYVGLDATFTAGNVDSGGDYDPSVWDEWGLIHAYDSATGYTITTDTGANTKTITGVPEPATIALLGLGGVAVFRRKRRAC